QILITGANGQLGRALRSLYPNAIKTDAGGLDITNMAALQKFNWSNIRAIINAAAYTNVDGAESAEGQELADRVNNQAVGYLSAIAEQNDILLIHISTEYIFDGKKKEPYTEEDKPNPQGVYAKSKADGDIQAAKAPKHYIVRTSWVVGDGKNFARTMLALGQKGISPTVVNDQIGRPTFTSELAMGIKFLIDQNAPFGIYNLTNEGEPVSWADFTRAIFKEAGYDLRVTDTTSAEYFADKPNAASRPANSVLDLSKIESLGFTPRDWRENLREYVKKESAK
ncbi:MAG TPA: dTDP-4-dehydrorhamnose reductase, partial [Candidatus Saccharimonadales bacterium]|nr:dTDP-4-dehydrorhamnose reductase [Candidatus Saccharimonadales bacterium]